MDFNYHQHDLNLIEFNHNVYFSDPIYLQTNYLH